MQNPGPRESARNRARKPEVKTREEKVYSLLSNKKVIKIRNSNVSQETKNERSAVPRTEHWIETQLKNVLQKYLKSTYSPLT